MTQSRTPRKATPRGAVELRHARDNFDWVGFLDKRRREDDERALAGARRMALEKAFAAGEASAHRESEIAAALMKLAEFYMQKALDAALAPYRREKERRRRGQLSNPGGRPSKVNRDDDWLAEYEARRTRFRTLSPGEIYGDIASKHGKTVATVMSAISEARTRRKRSASKT